MNLPAFPGLLTAVLADAAERIYEYCIIPEEAAAVVEGSVPPSWPENGQVP